jgi:hypothetical protein
MNEKEAENKQLEDLLRKAHLPEPSQQLHERITAAAKRAWNQTPPELPWLIPFSRLVASAAAAIVIIWLANYYSECTLAQWQSEKFPATIEQHHDQESLPEIPYGPFVRRLVSVNHQSFIINASALNEHVETLRLILNEVQQNIITKPSIPTGGGSSLITNPSHAGLYS